MIGKRAKKIGHTLIARHQKPANLWENNSGNSVLGLIAKGIIGRCSWIMKRKREDQESDR